MRDDTADYRALFLSGVPLMDTRAPTEFARGAFPGAVNLPLMSDSERAAVGTCYKNQGQEAAIKLGHQLVSGTIKAQRIEAWAAFAQANPDGFLYCFRGGLRSQITQQWLQAEAGIRYPRVAGGYKAMRSFLLGQLEESVTSCGHVVLGGMTGTGKTDVLRALPNSIDLEGHAQHRGSSFGRHAFGQPAQIDFENRLAIDYMKKREAGLRSFVLEDEGRFIGSCSLPLQLAQLMPSCPMVWLEDSFENRVERILRDYVVDLQAEFVALYGEEAGFAQFRERLRQSLGKIARRLGDARHREVAGLMDDALRVHGSTGEVALHRSWIERLLADYYDPMYTYQSQSKASRVVFAGSQDAVLEYLQGLPVSH